MVEQDDLDFIWTTNMVTVEGVQSSIMIKDVKIAIDFTRIMKCSVIGAPNWRTHLMEDKLTRPIFGWMPNEGFVAVSAFVLLLMIAFCIIASTVSFLR